MGSSKVWRKGRWFWYCTESNNASDWKDHWACGARSRLTYTTEKEAKKASYNHRSKTNHFVNVQQLD